MSKAVSIDKDAGKPRTLFGYDVLELLGEGAGSSIYLASDPDTKQVFALKHVVRRNEKDERFLEQLEAEYAVASRVSHPGLRRAYDFKATRTLLRRTTEAAVLMELVDGTPLDQRMPDTLSEVVSCFVEVAAALEALHRLGFVHCDLKPNNILIGAEGRVKVIDYGQACRIGTAKKRIQGTPDYISPEQVKCAPLTVRTDVYNLGATMYWALGGKRLPTLYTLNKGENSFLVDSYVEPPHAINTLVPEGISNLVMECVRSNPLKRPADAGEVRRRLEILLHVLRRNETTMVA